MLVVVGVVVASWVGVFRVRRGRWPGTPLYRRLGLAPPNLAGRGWGDGPWLHARHTVHRDSHVLSRCVEFVRRRWRVLWRDSMENPTTRANLDRAAWQTPPRVSRPSLPQCPARRL